MSKRLIIRFILFAITLFPSLKSNAQNVFFGDTLRFDSVVICKLLYSKNIIQKSIPRSSFKDTLILSNKQKKKIELFFDRKELFSEDTSPVMFLLSGNKTFENKELLAFDYETPNRIFRVYVNTDDIWIAAANPDLHHHTIAPVYKSPGFYYFLSDVRKVKEFYKNKVYAEPTDLIKKYAKKKILIEYSDSLGKITSCTVSGKQIAFGNKKVKDAETLKFCLTRLDDMFYNGNDMSQFYHIEDKIKPEGKLSITVEHKDSTEILIKDKVIDADRVMYNEKLYELLDCIINLSK